MIVCSHYLILKGSKALSQLLSPSENQLVIIKELWQAGFAMLFALCKQSYV